MTHVQGLNPSLKKTGLHFSKHSPIEDEKIIALISTKRERKILVHVQCTLVVLVGLCSTHFYIYTEIIFIKSYLSGKAAGR